MTLFVYLCTFNAVCLPGYFGKSCNRICPPSTFGRKCGQTCPSECVHCDHVKGCLFSSRKAVYLTTSEKGDELFYSSKTYLQTTEKITLYFSKHSEPKDEININYLLVGVGGAISLFLFILIMQLCKKHTSTKRKSTNLRMDNGNHTTDESTNQTQNCNRKDSYQIPKVNKSLPFYDHMNSEYQEIDECLERKNAFAFFNGQGRFEKKHPLSCPSSSCASGNEDQRFPLKTSNSTQFTINTCLDVVH